VESLPCSQYSAICTVLKEPSRHTVGYQYPQTYLKAWAKLSILARHADTEKVLFQPSHKPTIDPVTVLVQFAHEFDIIFIPQPTLATVLKNIQRNGLPHLSKGSYTITELSNLIK
jgi:hypothetical protein